MNLDDMFLHVPHEITNLFVYVDDKEIFILFTYIFKFKKLSTISPWGIKSQEDVFE